MSKDFSSITIVGHVAKDVEMKITEGGLTITNFSVAVNDYKEGDVDFHNIVCYKKLAEIAGEYVKKGKQILVSGRQKNRSYEKDGTKKYFSEIQADNIQLLGKKDD